MRVTYQYFLNNLAQRYLASGSCLTDKVNDEIAFVDMAIRNSQGEDSVGRCLTESIEGAVLAAAKLGLSFNPALAYAHLKAIRPEDTNELECVLDLTLKGMLHAFSMVEGMKVECLQAVYPHSRTAWRGDLMSASVAPGVITQGCNAPITGAICVMTTKNGDLLPTTITRPELERLAELSGIEKDVFDVEFALRHTFKRALKTLTCPVNSQLGKLQQAVREIDAHLFKLKTPTDNSVFTPMAAEEMQRRYKPGA